MFKIRHPEIDATGESSEEAFKQVWEPRGWERVDEAVAAAMDVLGVNVTSLDQLSKQQLIEFGAQRGVEVSGSMSKADLIDAVGGVAAPAMGVAQNEYVDEEEDLLAMTKEQLVALAESRGIAGATMSKSKPDLIDMIESES
jgi:hypothetical protein